MKCDNTWEKCVAVFLEEPNGTAFEVHPNIEQASAAFPDVQDRSKLRFVYGEYNDNRHPLMRVHGKEMRMADVIRSLHSKEITSLQLNDQ